MLIYRKERGNKGGKMIKIIIVLTIALSGCGTSLTYSGKVQAGRDVTIDGSGGSVDMSSAKVQAGRDISMCANDGLKLPNKSIRAPRDINIRTRCK